MGVALDSILIRRFFYSRGSMTSVDRVSISFESDGSIAEYRLHKHPHSVFHFGVVALLEFLE
jgi:hypothetical protein